MNFSHPHDADRRGRRSLQGFGKIFAISRQPLCEKFNLSFASTFGGGGKRTATDLQQHHLHLVGTGVLDGPLQRFGNFFAISRQPIFEKFNFSFASTFGGGGKRTATDLQQHHLHLVGTDVLGGPHREGEKNSLFLRVWRRRK
jgi:hypothetical protein